MTADVPIFAVLGHPNEGKSSVVSTLTEDDTVPVSPFPGETRSCRTYPVFIDGVEIIRFVDTPGFQEPRKTLRWFESYQGTDDSLFEDFERDHAGDPRFREECEMLRPLAAGACIIYVVDGSRPIRSADEAEMEILRRTGRPRMALINSKAGEQAHIEGWKRAFSKTFNVVRVFNAHRACFRERIELLRTLKAIEQNWGESIQAVIDALERDWESRIATGAEEILDTLRTILTHRVAETSTAVNRTATRAHAARIVETYTREVSDLERDCRHRLRRLFKHNIFKADLPPQTILESDLFAHETWSVLGLTRTQLTASMAVLGAALGAGVDVALAELTFGIFMFAGAVAGGAMGFGATHPLSQLRVHIGPLSGKLGGRRVSVGPLRNPQLMFVFLDRALLAFGYLANWAHAHRKTPDELPLETGFTSRWPESRRLLFVRYMAATQRRTPFRPDRLEPDLRAALETALHDGRTGTGK